MNTVFNIIDPRNDSVEVDVDRVKQILRNIMKEYGYSDEEILNILFYVEFSKNSPEHRFVRSGVKAMNGNIGAWEQAGELLFDIRQEAQESGEDWQFFNLLLPGEGLDALIASQLVIVLPDKRVMSAGIQPKQIALALARTLKLSKRGPQWRSIYSAHGNV